MSKQYRTTKKFPGYTLKENIEFLQKCYSRGELIKLDFNGHTLYSDKVSLEETYNEVLGETYSEYIAKTNKKKEEFKSWTEEFDLEEDENEENSDELEY